MKTDLEITAPGAAEGAQLAELYREAQSGLRRVIALGIFCYEIKSKLRHGQFQDWLAKNCQQISYRSVEQYMQLTRDVLGACGLTMADLEARFQIRSTLRICHGGEFLLLPDAEVPPETRALRAKIFEIIDGKSARQLCWEFRSAEPTQLGGDHLWAKWLRAHHPELIHDGKIPTRAQVKKAIREEFLQTQAESHDPSALALAQKKIAVRLLERLTTSLGHAVEFEWLHHCDADLLPALELNLERFTTALRARKARR